MRYPTPSRKSAQKWRQTGGPRHVRGRFYLIQNLGATATTTKRWTFVCTGEESWGGV